jgi:hypothetical protein
VPPPKYNGNTDPHKFLMCYKATVASDEGDEATLAKSHHFFRGCSSKLILQATGKMNLFLAAVKREVSTQLPGVLSGVQH